MALPAQAREVIAELRHDGHARGLDQVFGRLDHRLRAHARAADLRHGVEQEALRRLGQAAVMKGERPLHVAVPQIACEPRHVLARERLDAKLLELPEQQARERVVRCEAAMQCRVAVQQAQRQAVGRAAERAEVVVFERGAQVRREHG